jgi:hypothetical protein
LRHPKAIKEEEEEEEVGLADWLCDSRNLTSMPRRQAYVTSRIGLRTFALTSSGSGRAMT